MANEQTSVPLYAAAEVLTAANMNISAGTGVPVFATTVTRDAAFGGAGEKVLAEGQLCYLSSTNVVQYYDGAAWATLGPSTAGGLVCVKAETTVTAASSFTADNIFTSSYSNYFMLMRFTTTSTAGPALQLRVGGVSASSNYNWQQISANGSTISAARYNSNSSIDVINGTNGNFPAQYSITLMSPAVATETNFYMNPAFSSGNFTAVRADTNWGVHTTATAYDGFEIALASGTITATYAVYGYSKTV
jgi:hypothetical protein